MQFKSSARIRFISLAIITGCLIIPAASIRAQGLPSLFDSPWRGFDTGIFGNGFAPASFATGDLDGDGDADVLVGDSFAGGFENGGTGVSILKNNGDKTFATPVYYPLAQGQTVGEVALSDFDADGDLDAFATVRGNFDQMTKIRVWRNNGNGTLATSIEFQTGQGPTALIITDFTGDGKADVATANYGGGGSLSLLKHNGQTGAAAGFLAPTTFSTGLSAEKIAAADVNGDGKLDIAVGGSNLNTGIVSISTMLNDGAGNFASPVAYDAAPGARLSSNAVALRDLDNDGDADLIGGGTYSAGSSDYGALTIRRNNGSGVFGVAEVYQFDNFTPHPKDLTTGDLNGDGFADVIAAVPSGRASEGYVTLLSNGAGGFQTPKYYEGSQQTFDVAALDIDGDGDLDVLTLANSSAAITVHENSGNGVFRVLPRYEVASLSDAVESADIDHDGDVDIVVNGEVDIASNAAVVKILKNNGDGTFAPATSYTPPRNFADMKLRDLNGDGFVDLLFAPDGNYPSYHIGTALNNGDGSFAPTVVRQLFASGEGSIDAFDFDSDGDRDIIFVEEETSPGVGARIFILRNDGNQNFFQMPNLNPPGLPHGLAIADATGDGKADIITAVSGSMEVFPGNGDLTFGAVILSTSEPYKFTTADFNHDGKIDVGMIMQQPSFGTDTIATALGNGNGTFQAIRTQTGSSVLENLRISADLEAADFNGDGNIDLLTFNYASNDVSLFLNNGDGSLRPHQRYGIGNTPILGTVADFNRDGKLDIAAAIGLPPSGLHNAIVVLRNTSVRAGKNLFDFDGDGKADLGVFRQGAWYLQQSTSGFKAVQFGLATDAPVPGDYDGDGKADIAVWRSSSGSWYILQSSDGAVHSEAFGTNGDLPIAGDFDGDGRGDLCVFRQSSGVWYIQQSTAGFRAEQFGATGDVPLPGDFDGDGKSDLAVFRGGAWYIRQSAAGFRAEQFGIGTDAAVPGDYDGDGKTDLAVFRTGGNWYIRRSSDNGFSAQQWGLGSDVAAAGDYDGDGKTDVTVFRPSNGTWYILQSSNAAFRSEAFGQSGDIAISSAFVR